MWSGPMSAWIVLSSVSLGAHEPSQHAHTPSPSKHRHVHSPMGRTQTSRALDLSTMLAGVSLYDAFPATLEGGDVGLTAKFVDGHAPETDRAFVCTHKCADATRCPALADRATVTRRLLQSLRPPALVEKWLAILEKELIER